MKKIVLMILSSLFPLIVFAADDSNTLSFAPPPNDYSVVFLGNIFGIVDGVLHGNGSQIMGAMFSVFNAAVLALGGIIIMYTLLVSTMNTAQEGQMLGQKWSSIWVPMRSTLGLALLIPKASGYCLMQIFVMWVVVQGVGAADKVWEAALNYLNRGGVIVQAQTSINPLDPLTDKGTGIPHAASVILSGTVCMAGLQKALENQRQKYLNRKGEGYPPCDKNAKGRMADFCDSPVPNLISSVNAVSYQNAKKGQSSYELPMPNLTDPKYSFLNGTCGSIQWVPFTGGPTKPITTMEEETASQAKFKAEAEAMSSNRAGYDRLSDAMETAEMSRAIAIQQMYIDLAQVAQIMVNNDPIFSTTKSDKEANKNYTQQFGTPYLSSGKQCVSSDDKNCSGWGPDGSSKTAPLFNGTEFQGAIADYDGVMNPTIRLFEQANKVKSASEQREFINNAIQQGWLMAGSYFFDLVKLSEASQPTSGSDSSSKTSIDSDTGLHKSVFSVGKITESFKDGCKDLCELFTYKADTTDPNAKSITDMKYVNGVVALIDGNGAVPVPNVKPGTNKVTTGDNASTAFGYINNSVILKIQGQPGLIAPQFGMNLVPDMQVGAQKLENINFPCGEVRIIVFSFCLGQLMGDIIYNLIIKNLFNFFITSFLQIVNQIVMAFLSVPLIGMAQIFQHGVSYIQQPMVNPIVALANMGVNYINFANELWLYLIGLAITSIIIPIFGVFMFALLMMAMPLLVAWLSTMVTVGFITAYYVPLLPYMIFTFAVIAWLITVIEAMVAAPIVAVGVTHPEGHDAFGKGEHAIMILMNVFLRPALMIIGYVSAIALSYVVVWVINAGFSNAVSFIQGDPVKVQQEQQKAQQKRGSNYYNFQSIAVESPVQKNQGAPMSEKASRIDTKLGYTGWAGIYGFFFSILIYTTLYLIAVQKAFTLITYLPDKVLRWIGGQPESIGQEAAGWAEEGKRQIGEAGGATMKAAGQIDQQLGGKAMSAMKKVTGGGGKGPEFGGKGGESTPSKGD